MGIASHIAAIRGNIPVDVTLVCVSKFHTQDAIMEAYDCGERDFGESRMQELLPKYEALPKDIRWHFIGHLQTNKVRQIIPFVHMIHSVDSLRLLETIHREAEKIQRRVKVLLEIHVAKEESKSGFTPDELTSISSYISTNNLYPWVEICGIMGMATNTNEIEEWRRCFREIKSVASTLQDQGIIGTVSKDCGKDTEDVIISMGMSDDYLIAIEEGSNMIRIGSTIFGERQY